jgi:hypothetical protein
MGSHQRTRMVGLFVVIWLAIGALAAGQRGYFGSEPQNCAGAATIGVTAAAGPLNYVGLNPKMNCKLPQPSS